MRVLVSAAFFLALAATACAEQTGLPNHYAVASSGWSPSPDSPLAEEDVRAAPPARPRLSQVVVLRSEGAYFDPNPRAPSAQLVVDEQVDSSAYDGDGFAFADGPSPYASHHWGGASHPVGSASSIGVWGADHGGSGGGHLGAGARGSAGHSSGGHGGGHGGGHR